MGSASGDWVDKTLDGQLIFGDWIMGVRDALLASSSLEEQFLIGKAAASEIYRRAARAPFEFTALVDKWLLEDSDPDVAQLAQDTGLSPRQLERMTKRYYGMPPKKLARKYRAVRAAHKLARGDSLDDTELGLASYDQSHLIREIKRFAGLTPQQMRKGQSSLQTEVSEGLKSLEGQVPPLISDA